LRPFQFKCRKRGRCEVLITEKKCNQRFVLINSVTFNSCTPVTVHYCYIHFLICQPEKFEYIWDYQEFGTSYFFAIMGKNKDHTRESKKAWLNFTTPDCSYFYPNDLTKCGISLLWWVKKWEVNLQLIVVFTVKIIFLELPKIVYYSVP
jgi:hypothetical protein